MIGSRTSLVNKTLNQALVRMLIGFDRALTADEGMPKPVSFQEPAAKCKRAKSVKQAATGEARDEKE